MAEPQNENRVLGGLRRALQEANAKPRDPRQGQDKRAKHLTSDQREILLATAHIPDRDQEFILQDGGRTTFAGPGDTDGAFVGGDREAEIPGAQDVDEGEWGRVSDPAYERTGAAKAQRAAIGDRSVEDHPTPVGREGEGSDREARAGQDLALDELVERAKALSVPGYAEMTKAELSVAVREALGVH